MDNHQQDALIEEIRNLRRDISRLHRTVAGGVALLAIVVIAVATEVRWFERAMVGVAIGALIAWLVWVFFQGRKVLAEARKNRPPARVVLTSIPPKS